jgi:hypothetical protein
VALEQVCRGLIAAARAAGTTRGGRMELRGEVVPAEVEA